MSRPKNWEPLHDGDPTPGDPYEVARLGKKLRDMATEIEKQSRNIKALSSVEGWDSDAGHAFHEIAGETSKRLKNAFDRYDEAASALGTKVHEGDSESNEYASELRRAQRMADKALQEFRAAETDHKSALRALEPYKDTVPTKEDSSERTKQGKKRDDAALLMAEAHSRIERAKEIRDDAANRAAKKIKRVIHHDKAHDPGRGFFNFIADHADFFSAAATVLAVVALAAAVVLSGGTLAVVLAGLAATMSATALTGRLYDVFARGGRFDWLKISLDVLGVFPGFGALKGLAAAAKGSRLAAARTALWSGFTNGFAVKRINNGVSLASKFLKSRGVTRFKLPEEGFNPEVVSRYIKGGSLVNLGVHKLMRLDDYDSSDSNYDHSTPQPEPSPSPQPSPQPSPSSRSFHAALAPAA